jgi:hypothetical protein
LRKEMRTWRNGGMLMKGQKTKVFVKRTEKEKRLKSHFIFNSIHHEIKSQHRSYNPRLCLLTGTRFHYLYGHYKVCTGTGHRLECWICDACLMAVSKGTFCWQSKMADQVLSRAKRREGHSITFSTVLYLTLPCRSLPPNDWTEYPDLSICLNRPVLSHVWMLFVNAT